MGEFKTLEDLTGQVFGRLTVIERAEDYIQPNGKHKPRWRCRCECGNEKIALASNLKRGITSSCGCFQKEGVSKRNYKHGGYANNEKLFSVWCGMLKRCYGVTDPHYKDYGERGITVCDEWKDDYSKFREWGLQNGYVENNNLSIDRIDVNGNYCPENCRWATPLTQQNNRRCCINITIGEETHTLKEWARIRNISYSTLYQRYKLKWEPERMLNFTD